MKVRFSSNMTIGEQTCVTLHMKAGKVCQTGFKSVSSSNDNRKLLTPRPGSLWATLFVGKPKVGITSGNTLTYQVRTSA